MKQITISQKQFDALVAIYTVCADNNTIRELTREQKLAIAKYTTKCRNTSKPDAERWRVDWVALGIEVKGKQAEDLWQQVGEHVEGSAKIFKKRTMPAMYEEFDEIPEGTVLKMSLVEAVETLAERGLVVHKMSVTRQGKSVVTEESGTEEIIEYLKSKKLSVEQLARIGKYAYWAIKAKTKFYSSDTRYPQYISELSEKLLAKGKPDRFANVDYKTLQESFPTIMNALLLMGYQPANIKPVIVGDDLSHWERTHWLEGVLGTEDLVENILGLAPRIEPEGKPIAHFNVLIGDVRKSRFTLEQIKQCILDRYEANKEVIDKYIQVPKPFYIKVRPYKPAVYNHRAIALDIMHNENLVIAPELFELIPIFQGKRPEEFYDEIQVFR